MKTVSKLFEAMLTKETTPVWGGRSSTPVGGPTAMFTWEPPGVSSLLLPHAVGPDRHSPTPWPGPSDRCDTSRRARFGCAR